MKDYLIKAPLLRFIVILLTAAMLNGACQDTSESEDSISTVIDAKTGATENVNGVLLYDLYCSECHYELEYTGIPNRTAAINQRAIENNDGHDLIGYMEALSALIDYDNPPGKSLEAISAVLTRENIRTGATLYEESCSECHGILSDSDIDANLRIAKEVQKAIDINAGGIMDIPDLLNLDLEQIEGISDALQGALLYGSNCVSGCHDPLTNSEVKGMSSGRIKRAIEINNGGMGTSSLTALTMAELHKIAVALEGD